MFGGKCNEDLSLFTIVFFDENGKFRGQMEDGSVLGSPAYNYAIVKMHDDVGYIDNWDNEFGHVDW